MKLKKALDLLFVISLSFTLSPGNLMAQEEGPRGQEPIKWKMLDCVTAQGPFDKLLVFQKDRPALDAKQVPLGSRLKNNETEVMIDVIIDDAIKGTTILPKLVFEDMQRVGEYYLKFQLIEPDGTARNAELKIFYGSFGVFHGVLKNLDIRTNDRIACDEP